MRDNFTEKLMDDFAPFCRNSLTPAGLEFVKEKLYFYAGHDSVPQPNRNKMYQLIEALDLEVNEDDEERVSEETSSKPKIDVKLSKKVSQISKVIKK